MEDLGALLADASDSDHNDADPNSDHNELNEENGLQLREGELFWNELMGIQQDLNAFAKEGNEKGYFDSHHVQAVQMTIREAERGLAYLKESMKEVANIDQQNVAQQNVAQQNVAQQNVAQQNVAQQNVEHGTKKRKRGRSSISLDATKECPGVWWRKDKRKKIECGLSQTDPKFKTGTMGTDCNGARLCSRHAQLYRRDLKRKEPGLMALLDVKK